MIGQTVSHYKILEKLGEGGMGIVYKAEDTKLKCKVALKFLPKAMTANPEARANFEQVAQAAAALTCGGILSIIRRKSPQQMRIGIFEKLYPYLKRK